ncbi:MAG: molybdate ABC transporter substrate-binding protein [Armatimonadota bacterium]
MKQYRGSPTITAFLRRSALLLFATLTCGCAPKPAPTVPKVNRDPNLLVVYTACAVSPMVEAARSQFLAENSGKSVDVVSGEPVKLAQRVVDGAVPDVFVCPGTAEIGNLEAEGLLDRDSRRVFGELEVVIVVPKGNPAAVREPDDLLSRATKIIVIATPGVTSAGTDAKRELERLKLWSRLQDRLLLRESPLAALREVAARKASAALLYDPCIRLDVRDGAPRDSVEMVSTLSAEGERGTRICAELHKRSPNPLLAQRFLRVLESQGQTVPAQSPAEGTPADE